MILMKRAIEGVEKQTEKCIRLLESGKALSKVMPELAKLDELGRKAHRSYPKLGLGNPEAVALAKLADHNPRVMAEALQQGYHYTIQAVLWDLSFAAIQLRDIKALGIAA